jgi:hypothetical protein
MDGDWVEATRCTWLHEAEVLRSVLEAGGIDARIPDEQGLGVLNVVGSVRVLVRSEDLERAAELLQSAAPAGPPPDAV